MGSNPQSLYPYDDTSDDLLIGGHVSMAEPDYFIGSVREALRTNSTALMIFLGPPQNTIRKDIGELRFDEGKKLWVDNHRSVKNIAVHFPYILNPTTIDEEKGRFYCQFIEEELIRMEKAGLSLMCLHPGSAKGGDRTRQADVLIERMRPIFAKHPNIRCSFETMAGSGSTLNVGINESALLVKKMNLDNFGITLDTCHLFASGEDFTDVDGILRKIERSIGFEKIFLIHLNDSVNPRGSNIDRHARIGQGMIGEGDLMRFALAKEFSNVPKILETPVDKENDSRLKEITMIRNLYLSKKL